MNIKYNLVENYRNDVAMINQYHNFISKIFPLISFKEWYEKGFWTSKYIPYSLIKNDEIISNVCVAIMDVIVDGRKKVAAQIGAVGTLPEYRHKGLSRYLMNYVLEKHSPDVQFFFLFANETVMEFYPRFGFNNIIENIFVAENKIPMSNYCARKLNPADKEDYVLLQALLKKRRPITECFGAENYDHITMWHILNVYRNDMYYLEDEEVIFIKTEAEGSLNIWEVIFGDEFNISEALRKIIGSSIIRRINYHFPPDQLKYEFNRVINKQSGLFIKGQTFEKSSMVKYPETAQT